MTPRRVREGSTLRRSDAARRRTRRYLIARDGLACARCGELIVGEVPSIGHRLAVSFGGSDHADNLGLEHSRCNNAGGSSAPAFFYDGEVPRQSSAASNGARGEPPRPNRTDVLSTRVRFPLIPPDPAERRR